MYNKSNTHQSIKIEKEYENIKLRRKLICPTTDNHMAKKKETVWERLSKIKNITRIDNALEEAGLRPNIIPKSTQSLKRPLFKKSMQSARNTLTPTTICVNRCSSLSQKMCIKDQNIKHELNEPMVQKYCTSTSLREYSKSLLDAKVLSEKYASTPNESSAEDSNEAYSLAPLLSSSSEDGTKIGTRSLHDFEHKFLQREINNNKPMAFEDIECVNYVVKPSSTEGNTDKSPKLLKSVLNAKLQNIFMNDSAVTYSDQIKSSVSLQQLQSYEIKTKESIHKIVSNSGEAQILKVDVVFKNIPSLEKEIEILRALGEKLEATLKSATSHRTCRDAMSQISFVSEKNSSTIFKLEYEIYKLPVKCNAQFSVQLIGIRVCLGLVKEFCIAKKSIVELKHESNRSFYIAVNAESSHMIRTSFKKLKETPNVLLRHVKPKNSQVAFNVLEQDPVFFHNAFNKLTSVCNSMPMNYNSYEEYRPPIKKNVCESGDSCFWNSADIEAYGNHNILLVDNTECKIKNIFASELEYGSGAENEFKTTPCSDPVIRGKERRRIRRRMTPMPLRAYYCPKNSLIKTILVGFVQMSTFLIFIMALTYPDARC